MLESLNAMQRYAAEHPGPIEVMAGPGTGKTQTIAGRVQWLVEKRGYVPQSIFVITFTRKARGNLQARFEDVFEAEVAAGINVSTIDALAYRINWADARMKKTRLAKMPRVLAEREAYQLFVEAKRSVGFNSALMNDLKAWNALREWKIGERNLDGLDPGLRRAIERYQEMLKENHKWDVADLVPNAIQILEENHELAAAFLVQAMLVDEWQDTAPVQYRLIRKVLELADCRDLFVVGAPAQSIYEWRGANYTALSQALRRDYPDLEPVTLELNYRSGRKIIAAAAAVALDYSEVHLQSVNGEGAVYHYEAPTDQHEAATIASVIRRLHDHDGLPWKDMAVLFRTWGQRSILENALVALDVPFNLADESRLPFYQTHEVLAMLGYLKAVQELRGASGGDGPELGGVLDLILNTPPRRGIGPTSLAMIMDGQPQIGWNELLRAMRRTDLRPQVRQSAADLFNLLVEMANAQQLTAPAALMQRVIDATLWEESLAVDLGGAEALRNLQELMREAQAYDDVPAFFAALRERVKVDWNYEGVMLSSIHAAKGLEWPAVFVTGLNEGILPHVNAIRGDRTPHEEARLAHVAFSRPRELLFISHARRRRKDEEFVDTAPSRYLSLLPGEELTRFDPARPDDVRLPGLNGGGAQSSDPDDLSYFGG